MVTRYFGGYSLFWWLLVILMVTRYFDGYSLFWWLLVILVVTRYFDAETIWIKACHCTSPLALYCIAFYSIFTLPLFPSLFIQFLFFFYSCSFATFTFSLFCQVQPSSGMKVLMYYGSGNSNISRVTLLCSGRYSLFVLPWCPSCICPFYFLFLIWVFRPADFLFTFDRGSTECNRYHVQQCSNDKPISQEVWNKKIPPAFSSFLALRRPPRVVASVGSVPRSRHILR